MVPANTPVSETAVVPAADVPEFAGPVDGVCVVCTVAPPVVESPVASEVFVVVGEAVVMAGIVKFKDVLVEIELFSPVIVCAGLVVAVGLELNTKEAVIKNGTVGVAIWIEPGVIVVAAPCGKVVESEGKSWLCAIALCK